MSAGDLQWCHRLTKSQHAHDFTGRGSARLGGRWNLRGQRVVYTAEHRSLAVLECLVHNAQWLGREGFTMVALPIGPDWDCAQYPGDVCPSPAESRLFGATWLAQGGTPLLRVPSAIVPGEYNLLINPLHPIVAGRLETAAQAKPFAFDKRFWPVC